MEKGFFPSGRIHKGKPRESAGTQSQESKAQ